MNRIEMRHLESAVKTLNETAARPVTPWADGHANIGNFHIYSDACGYALHVTMNAGGGVHNHASGCTKRELYDIIRAMTAGVLIGQQKGL